MSDPVAEVERGMIAIRRAQARRTLSRLARQRAGAQLDPAVLGVLDAVEEGAQRASTVGSIATALTIDQPRASRLVARAVAEGLLRRDADQRDGRRAVLVLTEAGQAALDRMHEFRRAVFAEAMADWPESDRADFGRLLTAFAERYAEISAE
ncbi:MarR family winged helix-turn-helix transcriptional regulator [Amycolatopsis nigrescens]|uniref:MarR family winged helix-turn-helix transcriptional regulator n=1 Tax=Amycolatopsis nigrescens TaxID=381445 RepID=UPI000362A42E|nr:MarR family winged helix-turn-helix transcriptional regulator [Amycolatopsis nigrescens]